MLAVVATAASPSDYGWDPASNPEPSGAAHINQTSVKWPPFAEAATWAAQQDLAAMRRAFDRDGFVVAHGILDVAALPVYSGIHDALMSGEIQTPGRHDLGAHVQQKVSGTENVGQVHVTRTRAHAGRFALEFAFASRDVSPLAAAGDVAVRPGSGCAGGAAASARPRDRQGVDRSRRRL